MLHVADQNNHLQEERIWSRAAPSQKTQDSLMTYVFPKQLESAFTSEEALHPVGPGVLEINFQT